MHALSVFSTLQELTESNPPQKKGTPQKEKKCKLEPMHLGVLA